MKKTILKSKTKEPGLVRFVQTGPDSFVEHVTYGGVQTLTANLTRKKALDEMFRFREAGYEDC